jgi:ankyrin repeat protein
MNPVQKFIMSIFLILFVRFPLLSQDIHRAASQGDLKTVKILIRSNPELLNKKDEGRGWTPIGLAAFSKHKAIVEYLIDQGADVNVKDKTLWTPLHAAVRGGDTEVIELLIKSGADVNARTFRDESPLSFAAGIQNNEVVSLLIQHEADVFHTMTDGETYLHFVSELGFEDITATLIKAGCNVNSRKRYGLTPLHMAAAYGHSEIAKTLLKNGANPNVKSDEHGTPLDLANAGSHSEVEKILLKAGAKQNIWTYPEIKGEYFGQEKPGLEPEKFASGLLPLVHRMFGPRLAFSPDGKEVFWPIASFHGAHRRIWTINQKDGKWGPPRKAHFSNSIDGSPCFSSDGKKLFFHSRTSPSEESGPVNINIFYVERKADGWSDPIDIGSPVNTKDNEVSLCVSKKGTLYFQGNYKDGFGSSDLYKSDFLNGNFQKPVNLGPKINSPYIETNPAIAPDESYMLFVSSQPGGHYRTSFFSLEIFVSFQLENGSWTKAINVGKEINALSPTSVSLSPDGKYIFFYSQTEKEFFWASTELIDQLKGKKSNEKNVFP